MIIIIMFTMIITNTVAVANQTNMMVKIFESSHFAKFGFEVLSLMLDSNPKQSFDDRNWREKLGSDRCGSKQMCKKYK